MRILAIEKTEEDLNVLLDRIQDAFPESNCTGFTDPLMAIKDFMIQIPDFTVFCADMHPIDGFTFARTIRSRYPEFTGLMLGTDDSQKEDALKYSLDFLVKPVDSGQLKETWERMQSFALK